MCRLHALLAELAPGGIAKEINASDVDTFLERLTPSTPVENLRYQLAVDLLDDVRRLDAQLKASHKKIRETIKPTPTSLTDVFGIGPMIAATLIGYTGDVRRFRNRQSPPSLQEVRRVVYVRALTIWWRSKPADSPKCRDRSRGHFSNVAERSLEGCPPS